MSMITWTRTPEMQAAVSIKINMLIMQTFACITVNKLFGAGGRGGQLEGAQTISALINVIIYNYNN